METIPEVPFRKKTFISLTNQEAVKEKIDYRLSRTLFLLLSLINPTRLVLRNFEGFFKTSTLDAPNFEIPLHPCRLLLVDSVVWIDPGRCSN
jgi:hypothetical protein